MNKKGITELRKLFKPETTAIDKIVIAFITHNNDGEAVVDSLTTRTLLAMEDEEVFKYLEISKGALAGKIEKNLINVDFEAVSGMSDEQTKLNELKASGLKDEEMVRNFVKEMADNYASGENLMITLAHGMYDIPVKNKDNLLDGESDEVYEYIIGSICPIKLEKAGLYYNAKDKAFMTIPQKLIVDKPEAGFLFPAFNDRATDLNQMVVYAKKADDIHPELIHYLSGSKAPLPADVQKNVFELLVEEVAGKTSFDEVKAMHGNLISRIDNRKFKDEDTKTDKNEIFDIISHGLGREVDKDQFDKAFENIMENYDGTDFALENLMDSDKFEIAVPAGIKIKVDPDKKELVEEQDINGSRCFVIPVGEGVEINGQLIN